MILTTHITAFRGDEETPIEVTGDVTKSYGRYYVDNLISSVPLVGAEVDEAHEALIDRARYEFIPDTETRD